MVSLAILRAVKLTPTLIARFALLPFREVKKPCLYCPGICLASCPTFLESGSMLLSPLGYSRHLELGRERCAKCWRCVQECPLQYPLPETFYSEAARVKLRIVKEGSPLLVSAKGLDEEYASRLASKLGAGLAVVEGLDQRYIEGKPLDKSSVKAVRKALESRVCFAVSPEAAHSLGAAFLPLALHSLGLKVEYEGPVHIPCLLRSRVPEILDALKTAGARITKVEKDSCLKVSPRPGVLYLCPRAQLLGLKNIYDLLL